MVGKPEVEPASWSDSVYLAAAFFCAAQRFLAASAMRARPSGDRLRFFLRFGIVAVPGCTFGGLPAFRFATVTAEPAARSARAFLSVAISASMSAITSFRALPKLYL